MVYNFLYSYHRRFKRSLLFTRTSQYHNTSKTVRAVGFKFCIMLLAMPVSVYPSYARKTQKTERIYPSFHPQGNKYILVRFKRVTIKFTPLLQASCLPFGLVQHISGRPWYTVHYSHIRARQHLQGRILMISICRWGNWQRIVSVSTFINRTKPVVSDWFSDLIFTRTRAYATLIYEPALPPWESGFMIYWNTRRCLGWYSSVTLW